MPAMTAERLAKMTPAGRRRWIASAGNVEMEVEVEAAPTAPATSSPSLLGRSSWEISVISPKTGVEKTFKKYWSKKQEVVIVGETTDSWVTLWKEDFKGNIVWDARSPVSKWLQNVATSTTLPKGLTFIKECHCRFCHKDLTHPASKFAGYGPICAAKYGLPWGQEA